MPLQYLEDTAPSGDTETLIRYLRLHVGDGDEAAGRREIDKAWGASAAAAARPPEVDREFVLETLRTRDRATLSHLLDLLTSATSSGEIPDLPVRWTDACREERPIEQAASARP